MVPVLGRLSFRDYGALIFGFLFLAFESLLQIIIVCLPKPVINWFYRRSRALFNRVSERPKHRSEEKKSGDRILNARDFGELCSIYGYTHEEHVVLTKDGYLLGLHRLPSKMGHKKTNPGSSTGKPVVYLHHGLLMNSEVWVCLTDAERALPFVLAEQGYDVWLGNNRCGAFRTFRPTCSISRNRGNKYSKKSLHHGPNSSKFWDFRFVASDLKNCLTSDFSNAAWTISHGTISRTLSITFLRLLRPKN